MEYVLIFISAIFVNNIILSQFLGICPFLGVSKKIDTSLGMSAAVAFVLTLATIVTWCVQKFVLDAFGLQYLQTIAFILVIAALVQMVEIILKKVSPALYQALGIFLPLITTNCAVLGVAILCIQKDFDLLQSVVYAFSTAIGFGLALTVFAGMREQLELVNIPKGMRGMAIVMLSAGLLSLAFMGFSGVDGGLRVLFGLDEGLSGHTNKRSLPTSGRFFFGVRSKCATNGLHILKMRQNENRELLCLKGFPTLL